MSKRLVIMHGLPGSGKSTFIHTLGLDYLSISTDTLRLLFSAPKESVYYEKPYSDGTKYYRIRQDKNRKVWKLTYQLLEERFADGSDTIIDACNFSRDFIRRYQKMAKPYGFRTVVLDFTNQKNLPLSDIIMRNRKRLHQDNGLRFVPEHVICDIRDKLEPVPEEVDRIDATKTDAVKNFWEWWNKKEKEGF